MGGSVEARLRDIDALLDHLTREQGESARTSMRHHGWIWPEDSNALRASISELVGLVRRYRLALEDLATLDQRDGVPPFLWPIASFAREALNEEVTP